MGSEREQVIIREEGRPGQLSADRAVFLYKRLIPRYTGDCECPRGGVRWVFPERAVYWKKLDKDEG